MWNDELRAIVLTLLIELFRLNELMANADETKKKKKSPRKVVSLSRTI